MKHCLSSLLFLFSFLVFCSAVSAADQDFRIGDLHYKLSGAWDSWTDTVDDDRFNYHTPHDASSPVALIISCDMIVDHSDANREQCYLDFINGSNGTNVNLSAYYIGDIPCATFDAGDMFQIGAKSMLGFLMLTDGHLYIITCSMNREVNQSVWDDVFLNIFYRRNNSYAKKNPVFNVSETKAPPRLFDLSELTTSELIKLSAEIRIAQSYISSGNNKEYHSKFLDIDLTDLTEEEFDLLYVSIENCRNARAKIDMVDTGKEKIKSFFAACAEHGIYFDTTKIDQEYPGTGDVYRLVKYEPKYLGTTYSLYFRVFTDGHIEYGMDSTGAYTSFDERLYSVLLSTVVNINEKDAQKRLKDFFMESYLSGENASMTFGSWNFKGFFSGSYRFLILNNR